MTNEALPWPVLLEDMLSGKSDLPFEGPLYGELYPNPPTPEIKLEILRAVAEQVFRRRKMAIVQTLKATQVLELIAFTISQTYIECGDDYQLADDQALTTINELLIQHDPNIIRCCKSKGLSHKQLLRQFLEGNK